MVGRVGPVQEAGRTIGPLVLVMLAASTDCAAGKDCHQGKWDASSSVCICDIGWDVAYAPPTHFADAPLKYLLAHDVTMRRSDS